VVYRGGLENRFGLTANGGSNPSPSAKNEEFVKEYGSYILLFLAAAVFAVLWKNGQLLRFSNYVQETREELKKCTWPTVDELKGSTVVVMLAILLLGGFTTIVDVVIAFLVKLING
jgi:preprotein translocase subunit SecE